MRRAIALGLAFMILASLGLTFSANNVSALGTGSTGSGVTDQQIVNITSPTMDEWLSSPIVTVSWTSNATDIVGYQVNYDGNWTPITTNDHQVLYGPWTWMNTIDVRAILSTGHPIDTSVTFFFDDAPPSVQITYPVENEYLNTSNINMTWQSSDGNGPGISYYEVIVDGGDPQVVYNTWFDHSFGANGSGDHKIVVIAFDAHGSSSTSVVDFTIITTAPELNMIFPIRWKLFQSDRHQHRMDWTGYQRDILSVSNISER